MQLSKVIGQREIVEIIKKMIDSNKMPHATLFTEKAGNRAENSRNILRVSAREGISRYIRIRSQPCITGKRTFNAKNVLNNCVACVGKGKVHHQQGADILADAPIDQRHQNKAASTPYKL